MLTTPVHKTWPSLLTPRGRNVVPLDLIVMVPVVGVSSGMVHSAYSPDISEKVSQLRNFWNRLRPAKTTTPEIKPATKLLMKFTSKLLHTVGTPCWPSFGFRWEAFR